MTAVVDIRQAWRVRAAVALAVLMIVGVVATPAAADDPRAILLLHTYGYDSPGRFPFDAAFARVLREVPGLELYIETLDPNRFPGELVPKTREHLRAKYAGKNIAAVAVVYDEALTFLLDQDDPLFPTVPIAAMLVRLPPSLSDRVSVILVGDLVGESIALAVKLNPRASRITIIDGAPPGGVTRGALYDEIQEQIDALGLEIPVHFLRNLPLDELLVRVRALPRDGIIFLARQYIGPRGEAVDHLEAVRQVAGAAPAPLYVSTDSMVSVGAVGGVVIPLQGMATDLARLALRISEEGSPPVPPTEGRLIPTFDWRQLQRWGIDERLLPPDTEIRFRELGLWDQYRWYVVGAVAVTVLQTGLIAGLVLQGARRRRMALALRESERHFRVMADTAPVLIWRSGIDKGRDFFNRPWLNFRGRIFEQEEGSGWIDGVHPDDRAACIRTCTAAFDARDPFRLEYRLQRADGEYRWVLDIGVPRYDDSGQFAGYIGSAIDFTERKQIEEQNRDLVGRLITGQEEERARLARDLHDDVSQRLAIVAIMLSRLKRRIVTPDVEPDTGGMVATLEERTSELAKAIRNISHELHPSVLQHEPLDSALRRHCADIAENHHLNVVFSAGDQLDSLRPEVALCLFRVAVEALSNVVRYAHARTVHVQLTATHEAIELRVDDDGIGFVLSERIGGGLGLRSIDERVRLNGGQVTVASAPGRGTHLLVTIPLAAAQADFIRVS